MFLYSIYQENTIQNYKNILSKRLERSVYWNEYKTKKRIKIRHTGIDLFSKLFVSGYVSWNNDVKRYNAKEYYLPEGIINNYIVIINGKIFYDQPIVSDINW